MGNAPCKDCPDRVVEPNCHMTCERYKEFQAYRKALADSRRSEQEYIGYRRWIQKRADKAHETMRKHKRYINHMK